MKGQLKEVHNGILSAKLVDLFSEYTAQALKNTKLSQKDVLRFRVSIETAMSTWLNKLGEGAECTFELKKRFGQIAITISCEGERCNPQDDLDEEFEILAKSSLLQALGLSSRYSYDNGINKVTFLPNSGFIKQLAPIIIAITCGIGLAVVLKAISPSVAMNFNTQIVEPVFFAIMNIIKTIACPLIFLAVLSGVYGFGDVAVLGTTGKKLLGRFIIMMFVILCIALAFIMPITGAIFSTYATQNFAIKDFLDLLFQFIPTSIVSPFANSNMLQIITMSIVCGFVMLILGDNVSALRAIIDQTYSVVQLLMEAVGRFMPCFIFFSMLRLFLSDEIVIKEIIQPVLCIIGATMILTFIIYPIILMRKYNIAFPLLIKKLLPTFLVAFTTASSAAALSTNLETCEKKLGISNNITKFGIPIGQTIFKPFCAIEYMTISLTLAKACNVTISITWLATALISCCILAIATPPISSGAISVLTALFFQLNIPETAMPIAISIELLVDYVITAGNVMCLQEEMIICADKTGMLNKEVLRSEEVLSESK